MRPRPTILACLWLAVAAITTAQDRPASDPEQPTFRTGIQSVRVDLYVTRDGEPVSDLRQEEVQVFEDGVAQRVETFERITFAGPGSARVVDPNTAAERRKLATDHRARLFVLFLTAPEQRATAAQRQAQPRQTQSQVIQMLNSNLRIAADGAIGGSTRDDWILGAAVQKELCQKIGDITAYLTYLQAHK